ncbi:MAG: tripartite tricarboxylate transporter substrate binding protein [Betaproteobacteria bacterium]|nr:tripartite tricarboxylate transporter substrate binding protein [Betaproteobacteria bacterium]
MKKSFTQPKAFTGVPMTLFSRPVDVNRRRTLLRASVAASTAALIGPVLAQSGFPSRPIRMVVPFAAGGPADMMTRALANALATQTGHQWVVENRPGAGGNIAAAHVASSAPDGHTLLVAGQAILAINKPLFGKLSYDPERDFTWIGMMGSQPNVLVINTEAVPVSDMKGFIDLARAQPGKLAYGSNGVGSLAHLKAKRSPALPNVPTLIESGFADLDVPVWFAAVAHSATPVPVLASLRQALASATATGAYGAEMAKQHGSAEQISVEAAENMLVRERRIWAEAVKITGATAS